jgi:hypothetical protein
MRRLVRSAVSAGVVAFAATAAVAQQTPAAQPDPARQAAPAGAQAAQGASFSFQSTAAEVAQGFPAGGAPFAKAMRSFLDINTPNLKPALDHVSTLLPSLNGPQTETIGEVLGNLATALAGRGDTANLLLVQQMVAGLQSNSFLLAGYLRATGLTPQTAGLGGGAGGGGAGGGAGSIGGLSGSGVTNSGSSGGTSSSTTSSSTNPISGGGSATTTTQGSSSTTIYQVVSPSSL